MRNTNGKKKKGIIRWEAIIPIGIIFLLIALYFRLFFDANLKSLLSYTASYIHGAEINISDVSTSFINPEFRLQNIQVTDKAEPSRNLFSIGLIHLKLSGDALLRAKFVIEEANIKEIEAFSPRKSKGYVSPPKKAGGSSGELEKLEDEVIKQTQKEYDENVLGDLFQILGGTKAKQQLENIKEKLAAEKKLKEIEDYATTKEKEWKEKIENLPDPKEFDSLLKEAEALDFSSKDPVRSLKNFRRLEKIVKQAESNIDQYKEAERSFKQDFSKLEADVNNIDNLVKQDVEDLQKRLKIPNIDGKNLSKSIFLSYLDKKLVTARKYAEVAKEYMPKKKKESEGTKIVPRKRGEGSFVKFPITVGYPLFWLKKAEVSSKAYPENVYSGDIEGRLTNVTSAPSYINKPAVLNIKGDFPYQDINGLSIDIVADHTGDVAKQNFQIKVASMPISKIQLASTEDLKIAIEESKGVIDFQGEFVEQKLSVVFENYLKQPSFQLEAKDKKVNEILANVFESIPFVSIYGKFEGSWKKLNMRVSSNIGDEIVKGVKNEIQNKVDQAKKEIENFVNQKVSSQRKKLRSKIDAIESNSKEKLSAEEAKMTKKLSEVKGQLKKGKDSQKEKAKDKLEEGLKKLFD